MEHIDLVVVTDIFCFGVFLWVSLLVVGLVSLTRRGRSRGRQLIATLMSTPPRDLLRRQGAAGLALLPEVSNYPLPRPAGTTQAWTPAEAVFLITDEKEFKDLVRKAISALKAPPQLATSPLLALPLVEQRVLAAGVVDNRLTRATALRDILIEHIDELRPADDGVAPVGDAARFYNVLYYPYVRDLPRKRALSEARRLEEQRRRLAQREPSELEQVLRWLADVDEDTFYKWQRRASDTIAALLWESQCETRAASSY